MSSAQGDGGASWMVAIDHFGESASGNLLFATLGCTADNVAEHARTALSRIG